MQRKPVLLYQLGEADEAVRTRHGGYRDWYQRAWGGPLTVVDGRAGGRAPDPRAYAGAIVTGSRTSLVRPAPFMDDAAELLHRAHDAGTPVLGVCFGHQLIGYAFGGRVVPNPRGWEIGTCEVEVTEAGRRDPLFSYLPPRLRVNLTHEDMVAPESIDGGPLRVLAENALTPIQALAVGAHVRGVQFHPEFSGAVTRGYLETRRDVLADQDPDALIARTVDCPDAVAVLANFRHHFVERA